MSKFQPCEICGADDWQAVYAGPVRDGAFGSSPIEATVARCGACGVDRLEEVACHDDSIYLGDAYRRHVGETTSVAGFMSEHDELQRSRLPYALDYLPREARIADIGCAAGGFLDHISGLVGSVVAVDPCDHYHPALRARGYAVFSSVEEAAATAAGTIDRAFCLGVIEHVREPRRLLQQIRRLLAPDGMALIGTANRRDVMMSLMPDFYPSFFYRRVHRWYWDQASFRRLGDIAGLAVVDYRCGHRFGVSNALRWLRDRRPTGTQVLPPVASPVLDAPWMSHLVQTDQGDQLYFWLRSA